MSSVQNGIDAQGRITLFRGDDLTIPFLLELRNEGTQEYEPMNLTGCRIDFTVKKKADLIKAGDDDNVLKKTYESFDDPTSGERELVITNQDSDIIPSTYEYDIQVKLPNGEIHTKMRNTYTVPQDVTKDPQLPS